MQGVGGAIASAVSLSLMVNLFTEPGERAKAMGIFGFVASGGGSIGVLLGGILTDTISWHWIFLVNFPIGVLVVLLSLRLLPEVHVRMADQRLDIGGAVTVTGALMIAVYAIVNGNKNGWTSFETLGLLGVSLAVFRRLPRASSRRVDSPLVPLALFKLRNLATADVVGVLWAAAMFACVLPLGALPPVRARLQPAPGRPLVPALEPDHGRALDRPLGEARDALRLPGAAGHGPRARRRGDPAPRARARRRRRYLVDVLPSMILLGLGAGMAFNPVLLAAMSDVEPEESGLASGIINTSFMMGGALGLAVLASVAASRTSSLAASGSAHIDALTGGYHAAFLIGALFAGGAAVIGGLLLRNQPLPGHEQAPAGAPALETD